jgi:precorrin-6B methylase 2
VMANRVATAVRRIPEVDYTMVTAAGDAAATQNSASVYVRLKPLEARTRDQFVIMDQVRGVLKPYTSAGVRASVSGGGIGGGGGGGGQGDIQFVMQGPDLRELQRASDALAAKTRTIPGVVDVDTSLNAGNPEVSVRLDRAKASDLGVQIGDAAEALRLLVGGDQVTTYNEGGEQYEVHLRAGERDRQSEQAISRLPVPSSRLGSVTLENVASFTRGAAPSDIRRLNRQRQVTLGANLLPGTSQRAVQGRIEDASKDLGLSSDYQRGFSGRSRELNRTATAFLTAFALSLIFMYLVLAAQFESWLHPVTILLSLPLTLPFALLSIVIFGQSLNIFSALGLLVLFGVVKKNSILQIDHANQLRDAGMSARDAMIQASRDRLRPILMTTLAFVAGMIPLVLTNGVGSGTNHAIGFVIIGGQTLVLLLTLLVTPVTYSLFEDAREARLVVRSVAWMRPLLSRGGAAVLVALLSAAVVVAQGAGTHPVSGRQYAQTMGVQGAGWLDRPEREQEEMPDLALRLLKIAKGSTVADVGAGSGYMTLKLARIVGPTGRVYANDVQSGMLDLLQKNVTKAKVTNVTPVLGTFDDPKLPDGELDLVIMVDVYHEYSQPQKMLAHVREALKPTGRLVLFEYRAEDPDVPILPLHKMTVAQAKLEVEHEGFKLSKTQEDLPRQHLLTFMKN